MKYLSAALLACALAAVPDAALAATVATSSGKDGRIIKSVTENDLADIVRAEGYTVDEMHPLDIPSVRGKTADGLLFLVIGTACDTAEIPNCNGLVLQVRYDSDETVTTDGINQANLNQPAVGSWWDKENSTVGFDRYVVLDGGVTWGNIRQNLRVLFDAQDAASGYVFP